MSRRWWRDAGAVLALVLAVVAVVLAVRRWHWPNVSGWLGAGAVGLAAVSRFSAIGVHRRRGTGRPGVHARPSLLAEARAQAGGPPLPEPPTGPIMRIRHEEAAIALAIAAIPQGAHHRPGMWGAPPSCPDPANCGRSVWCPGDRPGCLDPSPFNSYGRVMLAPGKIPVYNPGRHEAAEAEEVSTA